MDDLVRPEASDEACRDRGALAGAADDGDGAGGIQSVGHAVQVVVRGVNRAGQVTRVPLPALSDVEDLQVGVRLGARRQVLRGHPLDAGHLAALLAPARHAAVQEPRELADPDGRAEPGGAASVLVVAADEHDLLLAVGDPGELRAEAGVELGDADRPGDVRVVELLVGADVDEQRALFALELDLARRERADLDAGGQQRPAVEIDDRLEVRRLRSELGDRLLDEAVLVVLAEDRVVLALVADRGGDLHVHARAAAHRAAEVPGPDLAGVGQREDLLVEAVEDPARALALVDGEIRPGDIADEQRVAAEDGPRLLAARAVHERERRVLRAVTGRVQRPHDDVAELQLPAVVEGLVLVVGLGQPVHVDRRARGGRQAPMAGDVVGVVVRLEDVLDADVHVPREAQVLVDLEAGIDDGGRSGAAVADEVRRAAEVVMGDLAKDHAAAS